MANLELCDKQNMVAYLKKPIGNEGFQEIVDFLNGSHIRYALTTNPTIYVFLIEKFWQTATVKIVDNGEQEIIATVNGKEFTITEAFVRRHLQLADVEVIQAAEGEGSGHPSKPQPPPSTAQPTNEEPIPTVVSSSLQKTQTPRQALKEVTELPQTSGSPRCQEAMGGSIAQTRSEKVPTQSYDSPLPRVNTLGSDGGKIQGRHGQEMEFETKVYTAEDVSTAGVAVTTTGASISTASPPRVSTAKDISTAETLVYIRRSAAKDKGKAKMDESEPKQTKTKLQQRQERAGYEAAVRLQEQLDEEERKRIVRVHEEDSSFNIEEWEDIQATIEVDEELA
ncbi:hypothetical protein Tco_0375287 [Tanacetum coccineum]